MVKTSWILGAFCLFALTFLADADPNLFVVAPNVMKIESDENVWITLHHTNIQTLDVTVYLQIYPDGQRKFSEKTVTVRKDNTVKVTLRVKWDDIPALSRKTYVRLTATCPSGYNESAVILVSKKSGYLFLQTDKPIYRPDNTVKFRAVSLDSAMKPSNNPVTLDIINPKGDVIKRIDKKTPTNGFIQDKFPLPKIIVYGNWSLNATYNDNRQPEDQKTSIVFEVKEYELPTFSVKVKTTNYYILKSQNEVQFWIYARYVFGTGVEGRCRLTFSLLFPNGNRDAIGAQTINVDGNTQAAITKNDFGDKWFPPNMPEGTRLLIEATLTESATGKQEKGQDASAVFVKSPFVISYERMPKYFRPGLPFVVKIDLTYPNNNAATNIRFEIEAFVIISGREQGAFSNGQRKKSHTTDGNGRYDVTLDIPGNAGELKIKVTTKDTDFQAAQQNSKEISVALHRSGKKEYLFLQLGAGTRDIMINRELQIRADFTNSASKKVNFMVVARGVILQNFVKITNDGTTITHANINILPLMSPRARVIAYYTNGNEVISDSLVLDIVKSCGEELTITPDKSTDYRPKDTVHFTINAARGSSISVLGVDKAVYLISERDVLTRSKMFNKMLAMDIGCGPGGGMDASDVFKQAGLIVLPKTGHVVSPMRADEKCPPAGSRRRRSTSETVDEILARLNNQDKACCRQGIRDSEDGTRTCPQLARTYGSSGSCERAYRDCCEAERLRVSSDRGRSGAKDQGLQKGAFQVDEIDVRDDFKDSWFYEFFTFRRNDRTRQMSRTLPHSITTWVVSGVSVSQDQGMCVAVPTNITSKKLFFVHVDLPYAAVRTEQLEVKATVYNLGDRDGLRVQVSMKADASICYAAEPGKYTDYYEITLNKGSAKSVTFPIVPLEATKIDNPAEIHVKALTETSGDEVIKQLRISNEGIKKEKTISVKLDPEGIMGDSGSGISNGIEINIDKAQRIHTLKIPLTFPLDTIPGTEACAVSIHGNLLGDMVPSGDFDVSKRIKIPAGCGEQNMITMAPLIYATRYLLRVGKLTGALEANAYDYITKGYRSQLAYKKSDGSFAAWTYYPSSTWLTALVTKVFCQASAFDQIGKKVREHVLDTVDWIINNAQDQSGKFVETHVVIHKEMLGQTLINDVTFTSYVVECILRCGADHADVINLNDRKYAVPLRRARQFLERNRHGELGNPYSQAILTYALALMDSPHKLEANQRLRSMSTFDPVTGMRFWSLDGKGVNHNTPDWYKETAPAAAIETASYALLTQLAISGSEAYFSYSGPIAAWLIRQRARSGTFVSTTDTVLGLEALAEYAFKANSRSSLDMQIRVFSGGDKLNENLRLNQINALIPIYIYDNLPVGSTLSVEAKGSGLAQFQVECEYNAPPKDDEGCPFVLKVEGTEYKATNQDLGDPNAPIPAAPRDDRSRFGRSAGGASNHVVRIESTVRYSGGQKVGMSILEVTLFTGFEPILVDLKKLKTDFVIDQYEITNSSVIFYLKEISSIVDTIVVFRATQKKQVGKTQPVAVKVYDYYEPKRRRCTKFYHPKDGSALLAQSCGDSAAERQVCECVAGTCAEYFGFARTHLPKGRAYNLKTKDDLFRDACRDAIYDYAVKVTAGRKNFNKSLSLVESEATIQMVIKLGRENLNVGEKMNFLWNTECPFPLMTPGVPYLVMGRDGKEFIGRDGRTKTKYVLDSSSHVVQWYSAGERRRYNHGLNTFARRLMNGCGQ